LQTLEALQRLAVANGDLEEYRKLTPLITAERARLDELVRRRDTDTIVVHPEIARRVEAAREELASARRRLEALETLERLAKHDSPAERAAAAVASEQARNDFDATESHHRNDALSYLR